MIRSPQHHLAAISAVGRRRHRHVNWASNSWRNCLLLIILTCLCIFLSTKKKNEIWFVFIIFDTNYFQAIQRALFFRENVSKMFMHNLFTFLDIQVPGDQNKNES